MTVVRPFTAHVPDTAIADVAARLAARRGFADIFGGDWAYGAPVPFVDRLCTHWRERFDWRALEARINRQPQVMVEVDGLALHAIHRRSPRADAVPLILLHGWPSSFLEFLDIVEPLAEPAWGEPAYHVVVPSLPGYGFSGYRAGLTPQAAATLFVELMAALGYDRFVVQGGNWGSLVGTEMARQFPERVAGLHLNSINASPPPEGEAVALSPLEARLLAAQQPPTSFPHFVTYTRAPAAIAHALADSPAGLAGWLGQWLYEWADVAWPDNPGLRPDWMVATIALYWFTGTAITAPMLYHTLVRDPPAERFITVPTGVFLPDAEIVRAPHGWAERHYTIVRWTEVRRGGHYPAIEVPDAFIGDLRAFTRALGETGGRA